MPEGFFKEGADVEKVAERLSSIMGGMKSNIDDTNSSTKEFIGNLLQTANSMGLLAETMQKSRGIYNDFNSSLERSTVIMQSFGKVINDVSQNLRGATTSVEGFISALSSLGTKTFPDVTKNLLITMAGHDRYVAQLKERKTMFEEEIKTNTDLIATIQARLERDKERAKVPGGRRRTPESIEEDVEGLRRLEQETKNLRIANFDTAEAIGVTTVRSQELKAALSTMFGYITLVIAATVGLAMAYDSSLQAKREVIYTLSRMGVGYMNNKDAMDAFNMSFTTMSSKWGMLREDMAKAVAPLTGLGIGIGRGGAEVTFAGGGIRKTYEVIADWTGAMTRLGVDASITSRAFGTLGTALNISGVALGDTFGKLAGLGEKSAMGMQAYIGQTISMLEITKKYGGAIEGAEIMVSAFDEGLKKGIYSIEALARLTSPAMWSPEQKGGLIALMQQFAPSEAKKLGITSDDMFKNMAALEMAARDKAKGGDPTTLILGTIKALQGVTRGGSPEAQTLMLQQMLEKTIGVQITTLDAVKAFQDPAKFAASLKLPEPGDVKKKAEDMYSLTMLMKESLVGKMEAVRSAVVDVGNIFRTAETKEEKQSRTQFWDFLKSGDVTRAMIAGKGKPLLGAQTGGYIPETAEYLLHAGEQVRRPGEGTGGDISISLGGIHVSVGDRGDMGSQINEAFDKLKKETIEEIESQWERSLHAH